jgi:GTP-binding protein Era
MPKFKSPIETQCGVVAIVGLPNAGKSTLLNAFIGQKVSIVTHKVQTTRTQVRGIWADVTSQVVFIDTPGIFMDPKRTLEKAMVQSAWSALDGVDLVLLVVDASRTPDNQVMDIVEKLKQRETKCALVLNKVDLVKDKTALLALSASLNSPQSFDMTFMLSALNEDRLDDVIKYIKEHIPVAPWLYPPDQVSDFSDRFLAAEVTREKLFINLHEELPYSLTVETEAWENFKRGDIKISQVIHVMTEGQRKIILGAKGEMLKRIGQQSRKELSELFGAPVHLKLFVRVSKNWINDPERYRHMGLNF